MSTHNIVSLAKERDRRRLANERPDADCIVCDPEGRDMFLFLVNWTCNGRSYGVQVPAYDEAHAQEQARAMRDTLAVAGLVVAQGSLPWHRGFDGGIDPQ